MLGEVTRQEMATAREDDAVREDTCRILKKDMVMIRGCILPLHSIFSLFLFINLLFVVFLFEYAKKFAFPSAGEVGHQSCLGSVHQAWDL